MSRPAMSPGRLLERNGDVAPRGMTVHDRTRLIGRLRAFPGCAWKTLKFAGQILGLRYASPNPRPFGAAFSGLRPVNPKICVANFGPRYVHPNPRAFGAPPLLKGVLGNEGGRALLRRFNAAAWLPLPCAGEGWGEGGRASDSVIALRTLLFGAWCRGLTDGQVEGLGGPSRRDRLADLRGQAGAGMRQPLAVHSLADVPIVAADRARKSDLLR